jgi:hypothetical protein
MSSTQLYEIVNRAVKDALAESPVHGSHYEAEYRSNPFFEVFGVSLDDFIAAQEARLN